MNAVRTVVVIDDDSESRETIAAFLQRKGLQTKFVSSADEFWNDSQPDEVSCAVVALGKKALAANEFLDQLPARKAALPVIVLGSEIDVPLAVRFMQGGACAVLQRPLDERQLWEAVQLGLKRHETEQAKRENRSTIKGRLAALTPDELDVFRRLLAGHPNKRIASDLDIGLRTVELRRSNIMRKMQSASLPDLVRMAILINFFDPERPPSEQMA